MKIIDELNLRDKVVFIRVDFNVPMDGDKILSNSKIKASLPTIQYAINQGAKVVLMSHLSKVKNIDDKKTKSLLPIAQELSNLLAKEIKFSTYSSKQPLEYAIKKLQSGDVLLLENVRFEDLNNNKESNDDAELAEHWSNLADIFINDAFGSSHRKHASLHGIVQKMKDKQKDVAIGFLMNKEIKALNRIIDKPHKPLIAIVGGAKVSDKINMIENILKECDKLLIGGAMSLTFKKAAGFSVGESKIELDQINNAKSLLEKYQDKIVLPTDFACAKEFANVESYNFTDNIPDEYYAMDIGPKTISAFCEILKDAKTIVWNGPLGVCEFKNFQKGTNEIAKYISELDNVYTVIGGGESICAIDNLNLHDKFGHISTGGGAFLKFLAGEGLIAIDVIK